MIGASLHVRSSRTPRCPCRRAAAGRARPRRQVQRRSAERLFGGGRRVDVVAGPAQVRDKRAQELRLVVDDQDPRRHRSGSAASVNRAHVPPPSRASSSSSHPVHLREAACDRQPEPGAARAAGVSARERLEQRGRIGAAQAAAAIEHLEQHLGFLPRSHPARRSCARELQRVVEQIHEHPLQLDRVDPHGRQVGGHRHRHPLGLADLVERLTDEIVDRPQLRMRPRRSCLQAREVEQVPTRRVIRASSSPIVSSRPARSSSDRCRSPLSRPPTAAAIVASGVRKSCEIACNSAVLIRSERRRASASRASSSSRSRSRAVETSVWNAASKRSLGHLVSLDQHPRDPAAAGRRAVRRCRRPAATRPPHPRAGRSHARAARPRRPAPAPWVASSDTITAVATYTASAVQLRPSASRRVSSGGRKKKLNASIDATATGTA